MGRTYRLRSFHALSLWDAMTFLDSKHTGQPVHGGPGALSDSELQDWEIFEFTPDPATEFYRDAWMDGVAVWTDQVIPAGSITLSSQWRERYATVRTW